MSIEQTIYDVIELSRYSEVPFLLMSNPGYGKTTIINKWAQEHGYHVEVLIGSRFSAEEILGYQVNEPGKTSLTHKNPEWYDRVMAKSQEGIPTLLFEDEISTCPEYVQGALLDLNFSRKIGNGKSLPEDCIVIAAANYAANLPSTMDLITPNINRFCIINLLEGMSTIDIFNEFTLPSEGAIDHKFNKFSKEDGENFDNMARDTFKKLLLKYSEKDSSLGYLDFSNTDVGSIYADADTNLYNICSGRSLSFLIKAAKAMAQCGIDSQEMCSKVSSGLAGLGTNNFTSIIQAQGWRKHLAEAVYRVVSAFASKGNLSTKDFSMEGTIAEVIQRFLQDTQKVGMSYGNMDIVKKICKRIEKEYGDIIAITSKFLEEAPDEEAKAQYISDLDSIRELYTYLEEIDSSSKEAHLLKKIHMSHLSYYSDFTEIPLQTLNLKELYSLDAPALFNELRVARIKLPGKDEELKQIARIKRGDREAFYEVNLRKAQSLANVNISTSIAKNNVKELVSFN